MDCSQEREADSSAKSCRFSHDDSSAWLRHLAERGYVVVQDAVPPVDVERALDLIWRDLEGGHGLRRSDPSTWPRGGLQNTGIVASLAQTAGPWHIRGCEGVQRAFAAIWDVRSEDLITSMDAVLVWTPWWRKPDNERIGLNAEYGGWARPSTEGLHLDQNPFDKPDLDCIQGMVPLLPVTPEVGGLEVVPFSHTPDAKERLKKDFPVLQRLGDWCPIGSRGSHTAGAFLIEANPGDLILWDARTIHGGRVGPGLPWGNDSSFTPPTQLARISVTVSMTPRSKASEKVQKRRRKGFQAGRAFNHCPHEAGTSSGTIHATREEGYHKFELSKKQSMVL
mmetsp:Transcript_3006/g.6465  ORF Transcript_3006/g.6465 Transcript_3006/m.6465 type:complete len:337 (-) Transcript_3006:47-1057(-)